MGLEVSVQYASAQGDLPRAEQLRDWAAAAWRGTADGEVVVRICDEEESRRLNQAFRRKDKPTNVLSFPYDRQPEIDVHHIGDLLICAPVVAREAAQQGKGGAAHWAHMVVHGMLHLQGFDHETDAEAQGMESLETGILNALGFPAPYATDDTQ